MTQKFMFWYCSYWTILYFHLKGFKKGPAFCAGTQGYNTGFINIVHGLAISYKIKRSLILCTIFKMQQKFDWFTTLRILGVLLLHLCFWLIWLQPKSIGDIFWYTQMIDVNNDFYGIMYEILQIYDTETFLPLSKSMTIYRHNCSLCSCSTNKILIAYNIAGILVAFSASIDERLDMFLDC